MATHVFGIRHHGPGSARSLLVALNELQPEVLLLEGPPDAADVLPLAANSAMQPPLALLIYVSDDPKRAVFYPFARFSPEWQAIRWALERNVPIRFIDLPQSIRLAAPADADSLSKPDREDPLRLLAQAAGESDAERWWERMVEHRQDSSAVFEAVLEAMSELRSATETEPDAIEQKREAWMRQTIRAAEKENFARIAVVCGAWHAPALVNRPPVKNDAGILKSLAKTKVAATWVPWTHGRLQFISGYGAGIESPGWYDHVWQSTDNVAVRWSSRVARLLREQDLDASPSHIIETVRLAETLAAMRDCSMPGLRELQEAVESVMLFGNRAPLRLIHDKLIVGESLGRIPDETPAIPLQRDLQAHQKRLRLPSDAAQRVLDLDLRNATDLERSHLLHRLRLLSVPWGDPERVSGKAGTFHEVWRLQWQPEFSVDIITASIWGNTVYEAAAAKARGAAEQAKSVVELGMLLETALLAALDPAMPALLARLSEQSALAADLAELMRTLPSLVRIRRYGDVRGTDTSQVAPVAVTIATRVSVGLPAACASLDDDAARKVMQDIEAVEESMALLQSQEETALWRTALQQLSDQQGVHGLVKGRCNRLLLDSAALDIPEIARRFSVALSPANDPVQSAAWAEGFLRGSALLLLHDEQLWALLDRWLSELKAEVFNAILPLVTRAFSNFAPAERRQLGERVREGRSTSQVSANPAEFDQERADAVLPLLAKILGLEQPQ